MANHRNLRKNPEWQVCCVLDTYLYIIFRHGLDFVELIRGIISPTNNTLSPRIYECLWFGSTTCILCVFLQSLRGYNYRHTGLSAGNFPHPPAPNLAS